jgi:hypothetical protein
VAPTFTKEANMSDPKDPNRAARAEQALRILEGIERAVSNRSECAIHIRRSVVTPLKAPRITLWDFASERLEFTGVDIRDALSQCVQFTGSVLDELAGLPGWGEPSQADAESDLEAFDRATGKAAAE